jgi:NADH-quinone oxidoreductase subunit I
MIGPLIKGFLLTARHMFKKPVTVNYPYQKVPVFPKYRGKQVLMRDENGLEKCVACGLCSVACPADAIYLEAAENDGTVMAGPRYASIYQIHKTRCIFCGMCEEACPVSAIFMGKDYELAVYSKDDHPRTPRLPHPACDFAFSRSAQRARPRLRWWDGDDALRAGRLHQPILRFPEPERSCARRGRA